MSRFSSHHMSKDVPAGTQVICFARYNEAGILEWFPDMWGMPEGYRRLKVERGGPVGTHPEGERGLHRQVLSLLPPNSYSPTWVPMPLSTGDGAFGKVCRPLAKEAMPACFDKPPREQFESVVQKHSFTLIIPTRSEVREASNSVQELSIRPRHAATPASLPHMTTQGLKRPRRTVSARQIIEFSGSESDESLVSEYKSPQRRPSSKTAHATVDNSPAVDGPPKKKLHSTVKEPAPKITLGFTELSATPSSVTTTSPCSKALLGSSSVGPATPLSCPPQVPVAIALPDALEGESGNSSTCQSCPLLSQALPLWDKHAESPLPILEKPNTPVPEFSALRSLSTPKSVHQNNRTFKKMSEIGSSHQGSDLPDLDIEIDVDRIFVSLPSEYDSRALQAFSEIDKENNALHNASSTAKQVSVAEQSTQTEIWAPDSCERRIKPSRLPADRAPKTSTKEVVYLSSEDEGHSAEVTQPNMSHRYFPRSTPNPRSISMVANASNTPCCSSELGLPRSTQIQSHPEYQDVYSQTSQSRSASRNQSGSAPKRGYRPPRPKTPAHLKHRDVRSFRRDVRDAVLADKMEKNNLQARANRKREEEQVRKCKPVQTIEG